MFSVLEIKGNRFVDFPMHPNHHLENEMAKAYKRIVFPKPVTEKGITVSVTQFMASVVFNLSSKPSSKDFSSQSFPLLIRREMRLFLLFLP